MELAPPEVGQLKRVAAAAEEKRTGDKKLDEEFSHNFSRVDILTD